jgi:predicted alpha/beta superfamily hydrolase
MTINGKEIHVYGATDKPLPVVYLHTFGNEGQRVWEQCRKVGTRRFVLVSISGLDWNADMSPWPIDKMFEGDEPCEGRGGEWLRTLVEDVVPQAEAGLQVAGRYLAGYSLAGLFAYWAACQTDCFDGIVSGSGSFWFPGFMDFAASHNFVKPLRAAYFSLGDRERITRNEVLATVEDNTRKLAANVAAKGIPTEFRLNNGNHYMQADWRMAKGIQWLLTETKKKI